MLTPPSTPAGTSASGISSSMISSDRVAGTEVYGADSKHIGEIDYLVIEKITGRVAYAVMSFGGFLGLGQSQYPVPWALLKYDTSLGGYRTTLTRDQLEGAPAYGDEDARNWNDASWNANVYRHYNIPPFF